MFIPKIGEMIQLDEHIFQMGWFNHQLGTVGVLDFWWFFFEASVLLGNLVQEYVSFFILEGDFCYEHQTP